ncbi:MAG: efflux RND transporter periplasmic adaptor subunit [Phycisphaerales bacterium]|nr:efflux RND transporter periplasmic adaptor subunit [Phycisphaerales bacterium]
MNKKKWITTLSGTALISTLAIVLIVNMVTSERTGEAKAADGDTSKKSGEKAVSVQVTTPTRRSVTRNLNMPATLLAGEMAELYAKTSGYIKTVEVDIGSRVRKGDALLVIDVPEMADELSQAEAVLKAKKAKVKQAQAMIETARAEVQRCEAEYKLKMITMDRKVRLRKENAIPQQQLDEARSELDVAEAEGKIAQTKVISGQADVHVAEAEVVMAEAAIKRLKTLMEYATPRAPFEGIITERHVDPGAFVRSAAEGSTSPLLSIAGDHFIRLSLEIPETDAPFVNPGTEVEIDVKALNGDPIKATITRTAGALKPNTRTMRAEVNLSNKNRKLKPGMYAQVTIKLETKHQAMVIPSKAIRVRGRDISVLVASGTVAKALPIRIGYDDGIWAEITDGLKGDEKIVVSANSVVAPGASVKAVLLGS